MQAIMIRDVWHDEVNYKKGTPAPAMHAVTFVQKGFAEAVKGPVVAEAAATEKVAVATVTGTKPSAKTK